MERSTRRLSRGICLALCVALLSACGLVRRLEMPLQGFEYRPDGKPSETLIVFLPGIFDPPENFARFGFMRAVHERGIDADMIAVDSHVRYYGEGAIVDRLRRDVIEPAKSRGYRRIVLVGTSLGGFGALLYARKHTDDIHAVILLAPLLRDGLGRRDPGRMLERRNRSEDMWPWLESYAANKETRPPIYLAYGHADKFAPINARLAALLPDAHVYRAPGDHDWVTWARLWEVGLARGWLSTLTASK